MQDNKIFETMKPGRLFMILTLPGIISMLMSSLYQVIDGMCVGKILGSEVFAAINLVMPLAIVNFSFADLIGVGSSVPIAIKLGEKNTKDACNIFTSSVIMIAASGAILGAIFYIFAEDFLLMMGADSSLISLAAEYLRTVSLFSPVTAVLFAVDNYLRICGKIKFSMSLNILMSVLCIVFEVLLLYVFKFGVWAAAFAFSFSMLICVAIAFVPFLMGKLDLHFVKPHFSLGMLRLVFVNGMPAFLFNIAGRISSIMMNAYLLGLGGATAVATYGVMMYADSVIQPVMYGLCDSLQPAVGYNYGAKHFDRIKSLERITFSICAALSLIMTFVMFFFKVPIVLLFVDKADSAVIEMSVHAMMYFALAYLVRWFCLAVQSYMTAVGKAVYATVISVCAALVFPVILILALAKPLGLDGLWLNMPLASALTAVVAGVLLVLFLKELNNEQKNADLKQLENKVEQATK